MFRTLGLFTEVLHVGHVVHINDFDGEFTVMSLVISSAMSPHLWHGADLLASNSNPLPITRNRKIANRQGASHEQFIHFAGLEIVAPNCAILGADNETIILTNQYVFYVKGYVGDRGCTVAVIPKCASTPSSIVRGSPSSPTVYMRIAEFDPAVIMCRPLGVYVSTVVPGVSRN